MKLKEAAGIVDIEVLQEFESERHKIMMRTIDVCEYGNLDDLKRFNQMLIDNNFAKDVVGGGGGDTYYSLKM
jgi:hypothetical protein